jgi:hypothetical protein
VIVAVAFTFAFLPIYLLIREPFRRLALHIDTGFYVSNHTILTGRWDFRKGWNARYAGCSKLFPEWFYTLIYLFHGPSGYKRLSRLYASLYNYLTAVAAGLAASLLFDGDVHYYVLGLMAFALLSSEAQYGVYSECAEVFGLLPQATGMGCLYYGLRHGETGWVFAGAFLWALGVFFIKLSDAPAWLMLFGAVALRDEGVWIAVLAGAGAAGLLFAAWVGWNGRNPFFLVRPLWGHEANFDAPLGTARLVHRLQEKVTCIIRVFRCQPWLIVTAVVAMTSPAGLPALFCVYGAALLIPYVAQAADCRYYLIPLLGPMSILVAHGCMVILDLGPLGGAVLVLLLTAWLLHNPLRAARLETRDLNRWCWAGFRPPREIEANWALERDIIHELRPVVGSSTILIYGPFNQGFVLMGTSYDTPIVAPETYLDAVHPGWQTELHEQWVASPPEFVLDTASCFSAADARLHLGLDYRLVRRTAGGFRLYRLCRSTPPAASLRTARTFRPVSRDVLETEERMAAGSTGGERGLVGAGVPADDMDEDGCAVQDAIEVLRRRGCRRVALYGAGRFTLRHADCYRSCGLSIVCVLDDRPGQVDGAMFDWPLRSPGEVPTGEFDGILVSSDRFAEMIRRRAQRLFGPRIPIAVPKFTSTTKPHRTETCPVTAMNEQT